MATLQMLINLFPAETGGIQAVAAVLLAVSALALGITVSAICRRASRRRHAVERARRRGLGERSANVFATLFQDERPVAVEALLSAPDLLTRRLVLAIARQRGLPAALQLAAQAAQLLDELGLRAPAFDGAPRPCEPLLLNDPGDPSRPGVVVFVGAVDQKNLIAVSPSPCPWPLRRNLLATPQPLPGAGATTPGRGTSPAARSVAPSVAPAVASAAASRGTNAVGSSAANSNGTPGNVAPLSPAFELALLLRPMPPQHEWVFTHALVETITNRRATVRVPCRIETVTLPDSGEPLLLRQRLQREERVLLDELRQSRAWSQRLSVTVIDISADGARVLLDQPLVRHQRLHLLLAQPDESLLALPLAEVVDVKHDGAGRTVAGLRFIGVRMKERVRLADHVRALAAPPAVHAQRLPRGPGR